MDNVRKQISVIDNNISKNIERNKTDRGFLSQNILNELRNLLEHIALYIYNTDKNEQLDNIYDNLKLSLKYIEDKSKYKDIKNFHNLLQTSVSHYTLDEENSERLMLKYLFYLFRTRNFCKNFLSMTILNNLQDFPTNLDTLSFQYYECVVDKIKQTNIFNNTKTDKFYIQKVKPFIIHKEMYYEITFTIAKDHVSKFDKLIAFSKYYIPDNYSTKLTLYYTNIKLQNLQLPVILITKWNIDIRPCEFSNFCSIFNSRHIQFTRNNNHEDFMRFLTEKELNLLDIVKFKNEEYIKIKNNFSKNDNFIRLFNCLDIARKIILENKFGANILSYILYTMNNQIIKKQISKKRNSYQPNPKLSNLFLKNESIPFDKMPFCFNPAGHIPKLNVLLECINSNGREHELLARKIQNNAETNGSLYTSMEDFKKDNIGILIKKYNTALYDKHKENRSIKILHDKFLFINEYQETLIKIIRLLNNFTRSGIDNYKENINKWLKNNKLDCKEKENYLSNLFCNSKLALIYGAAGTGKTTLIQYISSFFQDKTKLYLANTNTAVNNLRQRIDIQNSSFYTIASYKNIISKKFDIIFIDECSTISNKDIISVLQQTECGILICVGDVYQIESIRFGNWFLFAQNFFSNIQLELQHIYRTQSEKLQLLWEKVRTLDKSILESIIKNDTSENIQNFNFSRYVNDEIILCLNYGGIYGVNNINKFLQEKNTNKSFYFNGLSYKVDDPILFNEGSSRFGEEIHNNLKGIITKIKEDEKAIEFTIKINKIIQNINDNFKIVTKDNSGTEIKFSVTRLNSDEEDNNNNIVPFQVAYAISIHKAQGLEYDKVSIIIANEIEEQITHNIFYTAITRAKKELKIYWSPETENKILNSLKIKDVDKDFYLFKNSIQI